MKGVFIVGTDTEVGKTLIGGLLAKYFKEKGLSVGVYKPVESGVSDGRFLKDMSGDPAPIEEIVLYSLSYPVCPFVSAELEGVKIERSRILDTFRKRVPVYDFFICEGAGGLMVPLGDGFMVSDLVVDFGLPVLVVTRSSLGAINHTILTVEKLLSMGVDVAGVVINHITGGSGIPERTLKDVLSRFLTVDIAGELPYLGKGFSMDDAYAAFLGGIDGGFLSSFL